MTAVQFKTRLIHTVLCISLINFTVDISTYISKQILVNTCTAVHTRAFYFDQARIFWASLCQLIIPLSQSRSGSGHRIYILTVRSKDRYYSLLELAIANSSQYMDVILFGASCFPRHRLCHFLRSCGPLLKGVNRLCVEGSWLVSRTLVIFTSTGN